VFASHDFNPNDYANAILAGEPYPPSTSDAKATFKHSKGTYQESVGKEDISVAISKLTFGIDDISKQIKSLVESTTLMVFTAQANKPIDLCRSQLTMSIFLYRLQVPTISLGPWVLYVPALRI
jgi:hypothetical protein